MTRPHVCIPVGNTAIFQRNHPPGLSLLSPHQQYKDSGQPLPRVGLQADHPKEDGRDDDGDHGVDEVPDKGGDPVGCHAHAAHKLQVLCLRVQKHTEHKAEQTYFIVNFSAVTI